jgi:hypothetical protein
MRITSGGNVLIGTTTDDGAKFQVSGAATFSAGITGTSARFNNSNGAGNFILLNDGNVAFGAALGLGSSGDFVLSSIASSVVTERFRVARSTGAATFSDLAGVGSRAVLADANGVLSAPVSDISVKQNIVPIGYGLNEIIKMNPVWFDFVDEYKNFGEGRQNGNIAQEIAEIIPEAVFTTPSTGKMGINYDQIHAVYIKAIQELNNRITQLENN